MISYKPLKSDPNKYNVGCDDRHLRKLYQTAKDIQVWGRMVERYASSCNRPHGFWDSETAAVGRITAFLVNPFCDFFIAAINAEGDIAVDRTHDREDGERREDEDGEPLRFPQVIGGDDGTGEVLA
jgi:hypothetical protein